MDEPFSALDAITREETQDLACELLADRWVMLVTHDPAEACRIADRIFVLSGRPAVLTEAAAFPARGPRDRSEERRVGKECVRTCRSRGSPEHYKKTTNTNIIE